MAELDTQMPGWLQRNIAPTQSFDPTPWLQERYKRQIQAQTLPLEIQHMTLQNQAQQLSIEHQGMVNNEMADEIQLANSEMPALQDYAKLRAQTPGGSLAVTPPAFRSKNSLAAVAQWQQEDARTSYGIAMHQSIIAQINNVTKLSQDAPDMAIPQIGPDGRFDQNEYQNYVAKAGQVAQERLLGKTEWHNQLAAQNQELNQLKFQLGLQQKQTEAEDRSAFRTGLLDFKKSQRAIEVETVINKDQTIKSLAEQKISVMDDLAKFKQDHASWVPGWLGGKTKEDIEASVVGAQKSLREIEAQIALRESEIRNRLTPAAPEEPTGEDQGTPVLPAEFDYDPGSKSLKPRR